MLKPMSSLTTNARDYGARLKAGTTRDAHWGGSCPGMTRRGRAARKQKRGGLTRRVSNLSRHRRENLLLVRLLAADGLQLGEHGVDIEVVALLFGRLEFRLLAGGLGGRQQSGAAIGGIDR